MAHERTRERRFVRSADPGLSPEANRVLTQELRRVIGREEVEVPAGTARRHEERTAHRPSAIGTLASNRMALVLTLLVAIVVGGIISLITGSWWALVAAVALHAVGTLLVTLTVLQLTTQTEHVSPEAAAFLEQQGVTDPDQRLAELVEEFAGTQEAHGTAEVLSMGHNERTIDPNVDPGRAAVEQRTAMTPQSRPGPPAGQRSPIALLVHGVVVAMMVASVVIALVLDSGDAWWLPVVVVPLGAGLLVLQHLMARGEESRAGVRRRPGQDQGWTTHRLLPVIALVVGAVAAFMVIVGLIIGEL